MSRKFTEIAFTQSVKAVQRRQGSRGSNEALERARDPRDRLTDIEMAFVRSRDGFYQATVSETGWPYVQFRGGPAGFLKVLDARTLAYADLRGNRQYLSVGNMDADRRVSLILMDYAARRRLKIWATATLVERDDDPNLIRRLQDPAHPEDAERAVVLHIAAFDWNCPRHITPRFTRAEIAQGIPDASARPDRAGLTGSCAAARPRGSGPRPDQMSHLA